MKEKGKELEKLLSQYKNDEDKKCAENLINNVFPIIEKKYPEFVFRDMSYKEELICYIICGGNVKYLTPKQDQCDMSVKAAWRAASGSITTPELFDPTPEEYRAEMARKIIYYAIMRDCFLKKKVLFDDNMELGEQIKMLEKWYAGIYHRPSEQEAPRKMRLEIAAQIENMKQFYEKEKEERIEVQKRDDVEAVRNEIDSYIGQEI